MLRMEIALFLVLLLISFVYFSARRRPSALHRVYGMILLVTLLHLLLDGATIYTVNHLDTVPLLLNNLLHRLFIGTMVLVVYLFYLYIALLVQEETGKSQRFSLLASLFLVMAELGAFTLPVHYAVTPAGNYSDGIHAAVCYITVSFYLCLCVWLVVKNWRQLHIKKRLAIGSALLIEVAVSLLQAINPTWLISGMGMTLMVLAFYLTLENPEILRSELAEQKMSMLYLKSQINPHFLYNTLDAIRIQAQLNGDGKVADLLMRLVDFFRLSVKVDKTTVPLEEEMELVEAYLDLMCYRYPTLEVSYDMDPALENAAVPNFILQPLVENSLLHGLKNKGYRGHITISAQRCGADLELRVRDSGRGFARGMMEKIDQMLLYYVRPSQSQGSGVGLLNVQKRIKLLCGRAYGLTYTENPDGGVTAHLLLPLGKEVLQ